MATPAEWVSLCEKFQSAVNLSYVESKKDPETEPYRSKYGARDLLEGIKQLLGSEEAGEAEGAQGAGENGAAAAERERLRAVRLAAVEYELGVNHTDTQECSAGEEHLVKCLQLLERHRFSRECVSLYIQAQASKTETDPKLPRKIITTDFQGQDATQDLLGKMTRNPEPPGKSSAGWLLEDAMETAKEASCAALTAAQ